MRRARSSPVTLCPDCFGRGRSQFHGLTLQKPPRRVAAVRHAGLSPEERIALTCLQGLVAREQPSIVMVRSPEVEEFWLKWHVAKGHIDGFDTVADWTALIDAHRDRIKGVVVPDAGLFRGDVLALNVAACEDMLVGSPELAQRLKLPVAIDLRGRFGTYAEAMAWLWTTYKDRLNPRLCDFRHPALLPFCTFDYGCQWRALMFWIAGPKEEHLPGVDRPAEQRLMERILGEMPPLGVCIGFPGMGPGEGLGEPPGVELLSRFGKSLVCTNHTGNYSFWSSARVERLTQPKQPPAPALDRTKMYIALVLSDGDNQILWPAYFRKPFEHPAFGTFPLAFGMGPAIRELQPGMAQWYYEHATSTTEFIADVAIALVQCSRPIQGCQLRRRHEHHVGIAFRVDLRERVHVERPAVHEAVHERGPRVSHLLTNLA